MSMASQRAVGGGSENDTSILPLPQCREPQPGTLLKIGATPIRSDDLFAASWLGEGLNTACGSGGGRFGEDLSAVWIQLALPGPALTAALAARGLADLGPHLLAEGYVLDASAAHGILIGAHNSSGLFRGVQTLLQSLQPASGAATGCVVEPATIEDWPDAPLRGVYWVGSWCDSDAS